MLNELYRFFTSPNQNYNFNQGLWVGSGGNSGYQNDPLKRPPLDSGKNSLEMGPGLFLPGFPAFPYASGGLYGFCVSGVLPVGNPQWPNGFFGRSDFYGPRITYSDHSAEICLHIGLSTQRIKTPYDSNKDCFVVRVKPDEISIFGRGCVKNTFSRSGSHYQDAPDTFGESDPRIAGFPYSLYGCFVHNQPLSDEECFQLVGEMASLYGVGDYTAPSVPVVSFVGNSRSGLFLSVEMATPNDSDFRFFEIGVGIGNNSFQVLDSSYSVGSFEDYMRFGIPTTGPIHPQPSGVVQKNSFLLGPFTLGQNVRLQVRAVDVAGNRSSWVVTPFYEVKAPSDPTLVFSNYVRGKSGRSRKGRF